MSFVREQSDTRNVCFDSLQERYDSMMTFHRHVPQENLYRHLSKIIDGTAHMITFANRVLLVNHMISATQQTECTKNHMDHM